ncbi:MAG: type II toxin-antitoxin system Phd/YefM family antitoxin [Patescibacteria group bacterium]|jgi:antitoxin (DNA-binding transcriptional repressor) of toxin-antitoxin stability system
MVKVNIHELKARLSHFLQLVQNGEKVIVMKRNIPIGEISPPAPQKKRELGLARKRYANWKPDFSALLAPMNAEELAEWEKPLLQKE